MKKLLSLILSFVLTISILYFGNYNVFASTHSGTYENNIAWNLDEETGVLTISGYSHIPSCRPVYYAEYAPWYNYRDKIKSVIIENGITGIGNYVFYQCSNIINIVIPNGVKYIGYNAFEECSSLVSITIPESVTSIYSYAFKHCSSLKSIIIPDSVTSIGEYAFSACNSCISVTIGNSVSSIGKYAFYGCLKLTEITVDENNAEYTSVNGVLFNKTKTELILYPVGNMRTLYTVPDGVTSLVEFAFCYCTSIKSMTIPDSITTINIGAFYNCTSLADVYYTGYESDWNNIDIGTSNECLLNANIHFAACNHTYDSGKVTKSASCTATGVKTFTCTVCKTTKTEPITKTAHTYKTTTAKATTSKNGSVVTKCSECGAVESKSTIYYPKAIKLSSTSYVYNGKAKKPSVTIKDSNGKTISSSNYTVTYASGRKNVGKYSVKITFKGNYSGSKTLYFTIKPKTTSISSVSSPKSAQVKVKWKKVSNIDGYEIQVSKTSNFTSQTKKYTAKASLTNKSVKFVKKAKSYVRIRTYKKVNGKKYYSSWSKVESIKTK